MIRILIYDPATGRILRRVICPASVADLQAQEGEGWMLGEADDSLEYIVLDAVGTPTILSRPAMTPLLDGASIFADGADVARLVGLPDPCFVVFEGPGFRQEGEVSGGVAEFTTDAAGPHTVRVSAWPHLDWEGGFDAV